MAQPEDDASTVRDPTTPPPTDGPHEGLGAALSRVCRDAASDLDLAGAVVTVITTDAAQGVMGSSDAATTGMAQIPLAVGEGPTSDAFALRRPVLVPDLGEETRRWPGYVSEAARAGVCSVFAFPLQLGAARLGVLTCWDRRTRTLVQRETNTLLAVADLVAQMLLAPAHDGSVDGLAAQIDLAIHLPHEVYQAQGMAMVQLGVTLTEALDRLRGLAFATGQDLAALSRSVVDGTVRLDTDRPTEEASAD